MSLISFNYPWLHKRPKEEFVDKDWEKTLTYKLNIKILKLYININSLNFDSMLYCTCINALVETTHSWVYYKKNKTGYMKRIGEP